MNNEGIEIKNDEAKRELAKACIDNQFFSFVFSVALKSVEDKIENLSPLNVDEFRIYQSQRYCIKDLYNTFLYASQEEEQQNNSGIL